MRYFRLFILASILTGCLASNALTYTAESTTNQYHLARVRKGMSEKQVLQIMHKPYSYETFHAEDDIYDVWFYVTKPTGLDQTRMVAQNLTPLTFKNGILVGTGYTWYYYAMKAQAMELEPQKPVPINHHEKQTMEDRTFEKALRAPGKPSPSHLTAPEHGQQVPTQADKAREPLHTEKHTHPGHPIPHTHPVKIQTRTPTQHQVKTAPHTQQQSSPKADEKKLPPNVRIVSHNDPMSCEPCADDDYGPNERASEPPLNCGTCSTSNCSPDRFHALVLGMTETQIYRSFGQPKSHESFTFGNDAYDVWFYETYPSKTGKPSVIPQHMTPLTFKNARLMSKTDDGFFELKEKIERHAEMQEEIARREEVRRSPPKFIKPYVAVKPVMAVTSTELSKVHKGMTKEEVTDLLGIAIDQESYLVDNDEYEVWFYQVNPKTKKKDPDHLPITFKNGAVVGTNMKQYNKVRSKAGHECIDCYTPAVDRMEEDASEQNFNYW